MSVSENLLFNLNRTRWLICHLNIRHLVPHTDACTEAIIMPCMCSSFCILLSFNFQPGGGRNEVDPRFISLFSVFNITFPSQESLTKIYSSILNGHLEPFKKEVRELTSKITSCTLELYHKIIQNLPPTPSKFHYIFNLRDLSRVTQGLCLSTPDRFDNPGQFVRLWKNECLRVFYDRLTSAADKKIVNVS